MSFIKVVQRGIIKNKKNKNTPKDTVMFPDRSRKSGVDI